LKQSGKPNPSSKASPTKNRSLTENFKRIFSIIKHLNVHKWKGTLWIEIFGLGLAIYIPYFNGFNWPLDKWRIYACRQEVTSVPGRERIELTSRIFQNYSRDVEGKIVQVLMVGDRRCVVAVNNEELLQNGYLLLLNSRCEVLDSFAVKGPTPWIETKYLHWNMKSLVPSSEGEDGTRLGFLSVSQPYFDFTSCPTLILAFSILHDKLKIIGHLWYPGQGEIIPNKLITTENEYLFVGWVDSLSDIEGSLDSAMATANRMSKFDPFCLFKFKMKLDYGSDVRSTDEILSINKGQVIWYTFFPLMRTKDGTVFESKWSRVFLSSDTSIYIDYYYLDNPDRPWTFWGTYFLNPFSGEVAGHYMKRPTNTEMHEPKLIIPPPDY